MLLPTTLRRPESFYDTTIAGWVSPTANTITVSEVPVETNGYLVLERNTINEEIILYTGITGNTLTGVVRQLSASGNSEAGGAGIAHVSGTSIGNAVPHYYEARMQLAFNNHEILPEHSYRGSVDTFADLSTITNVDEGDMAQVRNPIRILYSWDDTNSIWIPLTDGGSGGGSVITGSSGGKPKSFQIRHLDQPNGSNVVKSLNGYQDTEFYNAVSFTTTPGPTIMVEFFDTLKTVLDLSAEWPECEQLISYVYRGGFIYLLGFTTQGGGEFRLYRYDGSDLSIAPVQMTILGQAFGVNPMVMTCDEDDFFFSGDAGGSANTYEIARYTIAGLSLTYASTVSLDTTPVVDSFAVLTNGTYIVATSGANTTIELFDDLGVSYDSQVYNPDYINLINWADTIYICNKGTSVSADQNTDAVKLDLGGEVNTDGSTISVIAEQDLTEGDPVGFSAPYDDRVALANWFEKFPLLDGNGSIIPATNEMVWIGGNRYAIATVSGGGGDLGCYVVEVNRDTMTSVEVLTSHGLVNSVEGKVAISRLDTDKFVIFYVNDGDNTNAKAIACSYAAGNVTGGPSTTISTGDDVGGAACACPFFETDRAIALFDGTAEDEARVVAISVDGALTITTIDTNLSLSGNDDFDNESNTKIMCQVDTNKAVIISNAANSPAVIVDMPVATISIGSPQNMVQNGANHSVDSAVDANFLFRADDAFVYVSISGTVMTIEDNINYGDQAGNVVCQDATTFYVYDNDGVSAVNSKISKITITGTTIDTPIPLSLRLPITARLIWLGTYWALHGKEATTKYNIEGMSNNYIGFVQNTVARGDTVFVKIAGIDLNQSGLVGGNIYRVFEGGLVLTGDPTVDYKVHSENATSVLI